MFQPFNLSRQEAPKKIAKPYESSYVAWLQHYYPKAVSKPMAYYHREFWEWLWKLSLDHSHPDYDAGFGIWSRGCGKTTSGLLAVAAIGALKKRRYGWLLSRTQAQANQKLLTLRTSISRINTGFLDAYPHMAKARTEEGHNLGWNAQQLICGDDEDRFVMEAIGLDTAVRGANIEFQRPDFLMPDDIDVLHDSPHMVEKNIEILTRSVLPAGSDTLATLGLQNLIHDDSIFARIADGRAKFLRNRKLFGDEAVPAFTGDFKVEEKEAPNGLPLYVITSGIPTWPEGFGIKEAEKEINETGLLAFENECQHLVGKSKEDKTFKEFDPIYHCITVSEFMRYWVGKGAIGWDLERMGRGELSGGMANRLTLPRGYSAMAQDWGNGQKHPTALRWMWRPGEGNPLTDTIFFIREQCWPTFPIKIDDPRATPSYRQTHLAILEVERELRLAPRASEAVPSIQFRLNSHERPEAAVAYRKDHLDLEPLYFHQINTSEAREGILHLQEFQHVDYSQVHPFRIDPRTFEAVPKHLCLVCGWSHNGRHLQGRPRALYVVADGQGELTVDKGGKLIASPAIDELGMARTRWEYPRHRPRETSEGEEKQAAKRDDDVIDTDKALAGHIYRMIKPLTERERLSLQYRKVYEGLQGLRAVA